MIKTGRFFPYLIICLLALLVYLPSFSGEFILDDTPLVKNNTYIRDWHSPGSYLAQEDGYDSNLTNGHTGYYRPLINLSYTLDYKIWGINGPGFRITNLLLHLLVCFILFSFYKLLIKKRDIALLLALLFALHPIGTESVSWVASRNNLLTTLLGILSLMFYIKAYEKERFFYYGISVLFFALSLFCKEFGLMLLPIFFIYQRTLNPQKKDIIKELREYLPYLIIGLLYFYLRNNVTGSLLSPSGFSGFWVRLYSVPYVLMFNIRLIFLPYRLHSFNVEAPDSLFDIGIICGILFLGFVICLLFIYRKNRMVLFSVLAFLLAIFPVSGLISTSAPSLIAMRWLYFPMAFILIILAEPLERMTSSTGRIHFIVFSCIALYLGLNSYVLNNYLWHSNRVFYKQEVMNFGNRYCAAGLAGVFFMEGNDVLALKYLLEGAEYGIYKPDEYIMYARILVTKGDMKNSLSNLYKARQYQLTKSQFGLLLNIRGMIYYKSNDPDNALRKYREAVLYIPEQAEVRENMGLAYGEIGEHAKAADSFKKAIRLHSRSDAVYNNLALAYILNNECQKAVTILDRKGFRESERAKGLLERAKNCLNKNKEHEI